MPRHTTVRGERYNWKNVYATRGCRPDIRSARGICSGATVEKNKVINAHGELGKTKKRKQFKNKLDRPLFDERATLCWQSRIGHGTRSWIYVGSCQEVISQTEAQPSHTYTRTYMHTPTLLLYYCAANKSFEHLYYRNRSDTVTKTKNRQSLRRLGGQPNSIR